MLEDTESVIVRTLQESDKARLFLLAKQVTRNVRGDLKTGRRPYIQYEDERYTNEILARSPDLIGAELTLVVDTDNLLTVRAFLPNGAELGVLSATGKWSRTPHSLATRKAANARRVLKVQHQSEPTNADPVHVMLQQLSVNAESDKRAALKYEKVRRGAGLPEDFRPSEATRKPNPFSAPKITPGKLNTERKSIVY
jgi:putative transposase